MSAILADELDALWRFALRLTSNKTDAEDLVQQTCLKALENAEQYRDQGRRRSWLFRIEHRIWLNLLRSRQIRSSGSFNNDRFSNIRTDEPNGSFQSAEIINSTDNEYYSPEFQLHLHQVLLEVESLPEAQRLVVVLICVEGFTYQETAEVLDIPIGTIMSRLARARMTLGKAMKNSSRGKKSANSQEEAL
ncbi:MAG: sigma-70 family RNA polymerase sigma factor [Gammaproteobacteria bacterium]|nr:sigma-70 family RNA polymerase sigma factor [Gammaproteobacteria bacterium]